MNCSHLKIFYTLIILLHIDISAQVWEWQNPMPQGNNLNSLFPVSSSIAYAVGDYSTLIKTTDSGENWNVVSQDSNLSFRSCFFFDENNGIIVGDRGCIAAVSYGGNFMSRIQSDVSADLHSVTFINSNTGFIAGSNGTLLRTTNSGNSWNRIILNTQKSFSKIFFSSPSNGFICGDGIILKSTDGGNNWSVIETSFGNDIFLSIDFFNNSIGWITGWQGLLLKTTDNGLTWRKKETGINAWIRSISFFDELNGTAVCSPGIMLITSDGGEIWEIDSSGIQFSLNSICFFDNNIGWIAGNKGVILKSIDKGNMWEFIPAGNETGNLNSISFRNENDGIAVGDKGLILKTTNGGIQWTKINLDTKNNFYDVTIDSKGFTFIAGQNYFIASSTDMGERWIVNEITTTGIGDFYRIYRNSKKLITIFTGSRLIYERYRSIAYLLEPKANPGQAIPPLYDIDSFNGGRCFIAGDKATIAISQSLDTLPSVFLLYTTPDKDLDYRGISAISNAEAFYCGSQGVIGLVTEWLPGRVLFNELDTLDVNLLNTIRFIDRKIGYTAGTNGSIYKTINGGTEWVKYKSRISNTINKLFFLNENTGWAVGRNGVILKLKPLQETSTTDTEFPGSLPAGFYLSQNFPNPFNPKTNITFTIPEMSFVTLKVYDVLGKEIAVILNEEKPAGKHTTEFNAENLHAGGQGISSGIYFYNIRVTPFSSTSFLTDTKKFILIK